MSRRVVEVTPSASRLTRSLRDVGHDFATALADLVDNSVSAGADTVSIDFVFAGRDSWLTVADNGTGMTSSEVDEALRFGSKRTYEEDDLGRFGLGLKTASLSQCRRVTVVSRHAPVYRRIAARTLDVDHVSSTDRWQVFTPRPVPPVVAAEDHLADSPGTVVILEKFDRVFEGVDPDGGWARRRLEKLAEETSEYLGMVFHRFIEEDVIGRRLTIAVNGEKARPWNPFAPREEGTQTLPVHRFALSAGGSSHEVMLRPYILPPRSLFSSQAEFERLGGPKRWNRQQGLYIYRADRLVQSGGWAGLRGIDEHTKLARASLDFPTALDEAFKINVAKMRVSIPSELRQSVARPLNELCTLADATYRRPANDRKSQPRQQSGRRQGDMMSVGLALEAAAVRADHLSALDDIMYHLRVADAELAAALGY